MEEKLYFKPADYGAGQKKKKEKEAKKDKPAKEKGDKRWLKLSIFLVIMIAVVLIIIWLMRGKTTISGQYPANIKNESLTCVLSGISYPRTGTYKETDKNIKINAIFSGDDSLRSISLIYTTDYEDKKAATSGEAWLHADFNWALAAANYNVDKFDNKFAIYDNEVILTISATPLELSEVAWPFFMLDGESAPKTLAQYQENYSEQGFECRTTIEE